jgi:hypothetical protein
MMKSAKKAQEQLINFIRKPGLLRIHNKIFTSAEPHLAVLNQRLRRKNVNFTGAGTLYHRSIKGCALKKAQAMAAQTGPSGSA